MQGGFKNLVNPGTHVSESDLEATREEREELHRRLRLRSHLLDALAARVEVSMPCSSPESG